MDNLCLEILLVEDNLTDVLLVEEALEEARTFKFALTHVKRLDEALGCLHNQRFDAVLLDLGLPDTQGLETFARMQSHYPKIPVLILSGLDDEAAALRAVQAGAQDYLVKGVINSKMLARTIRYAIERKQSAESVKSSEAGYRRLFETAQDGIFILDAETGQITDANPYLEELLGHKITEFIGKRLWEIAPFRHKTASQAAFATLQEKGSIHYDAIPLMTKDSRQVIVEFTSNLYAVESQHVIQCNIRDITERNRNELALRESEERYRLLVDSVQDYAIFMLSPGGHVTSWNTGAEHIKGYQAEEIIGWHFSIFYRPEEIEAGKPQMELEVASAQGYFEEEGLRVRKGGALFWAHVLITPVHDQAGQVRGFSKVTRDITERKRAEDALAELSQKTERRERMLSTGLSSMSDFAHIYDREGRFLFVNQPLLDLWGITLEEALGKNFFELGYPDKLAERLQRQVQEVFETRQRVTDESPYTSPAGLEGYYEYNFSPVFESDGTVDFVVGSTRDMTERKRIAQVLETTMIQLERSNNDLQHFASIASHDLQEPLRAIQAFGDRLQTKHGALLSEEARDYLTRMQNAAGRMRALIQDLLAYSRVTTKIRPFTPVDLAAATGAILSDLVIRLEETKGRVEVGELPTIQADAMQMRQLFQNLIANGLKFHREEEPPIVRVYTQPLPKAAQEKGKQLVQIVVEDNGIGFDEKYAERIFAPFERLHNQRKYSGTGIGLAICRKIAEQHGGGISVTSVPGQGSKFLIQLPLRQSEIALKSAAI